MEHSQDSVPASREVHTVAATESEPISSGVSGVVRLLEDGSVLKSPHTGSGAEESLADLEIEHRIYVRLGKHDRLLDMLSFSSEGIRFPFMKNGNLRDYLHEYKNLGLDIRLKWALQAAEGLQLLHSRGILHGDTSPRNFLVDDEMNIRIADFAGSSIDGSRPTVAECTRYYLPRHPNIFSTITTDLFALGSTIFEIMTGHAPYHDKSSEDVAALYTSRLFPNTDWIINGESILKCWRCEFCTAQEVLESMQPLTRELLHAGCVPRFGVSNNAPSF